MAEASGKVEPPANDIKKSKGVKTAASAGLGKRASSFFLAGFPLSKAVKNVILFFFKKSVIFFFCD